MSLGCCCFLMIVSTKLYSYSTPCEKTTYLNVWESLLGHTFLFIYLFSVCFVLVPPARVWGSRFFPASIFKQTQVRVKEMGECNACRDSLHWKCSYDADYCARLYFQTDMDPRYHFQTSLQKLLVLCVF